MRPVFRQHGVHPRIVEGAARRRQWYAVGAASRAAPAGLARLAGPTENQRCSPPSHSSVSGWPPSVRPWTNSPTWRRRRNKPKEWMLPCCRWRHKRGYCSTSIASANGWRRSARRSATPSIRDWYGTRKIARRAESVSDRRKPPVADAPGSPESERTELAIARVAQPRHDVRALV